MSDIFNFYRLKNFYLISVLLLSSQCRKDVDSDRDAKHASDSETGSKAVGVRVDPKKKLVGEKNVKNGTTAGNSSQANGSLKEPSAIASQNDTGSGIAPARAQAKAQAPDLSLDKTLVRDLGAAPAGAQAKA